MNNMSMREHERIRVNWSVRTKYKDSIISGNVCDITPRGLFFKAGTTEFEVGAVIEFRMYNWPKPITGVVKWSNYSKSHNAFGIGVEFTANSDTIAWIYALQKQSNTLNEDLLNIINGSNVHMVANVRAVLCFAIDICNLKPKYENILSLSFILDQTRIKYLNIVKRKLGY